MWPDMWLLVQMLKWRHLVKWCQNNPSNYYGFSRGFSPAYKNCKKVSSNKILYKWSKYIISLQNYPIKLTQIVLIKIYRPCFCHVHRSWCYRHLLQCGNIDINNRNIFVLYLKLYSSNIALSTDTKISISLK